MTLAEAKEWLDIDPADTSEDSLLLDLIQRSWAIVEQAIGWSFSAADTFVETVEADGTGTLWLSRNPTADPTEVLEMPQVGDAGEAITAAASDGWVRDGVRLLRKAGGVWTRGYRYQVTYSAGYEAGTEPPEVVQAVLGITGILYRGRGKEGFAHETAGPLYSYTKDGGIGKILESLPVWNLTA